MVGNSRPASGAEHMIAHYLEMLDMARGKSSTLHGDKVGVAELIVMRLYEKFFEGGTPPSFPGVEDRQARVEAMRRDLGDDFATLLLAHDCSAAYADPGLRRGVLEAVGADWGFYRAQTATLPALRKSGANLIRRAGGPITPGELGYSRADTRNVIRYALELRERFTILHLALLAGRLDALAEELADEFCK
jgi:glycerol-1-phosphate dehydrogenase [NAD(P)+]